MADTDCSGQKITTTSPSGKRAVVAPRVLTNADEGLRNASGPAGWVSDDEARSACWPGKSWSLDRELPEVKVFSCTALSSCQMSLGRRLMLLPVSPMQILSTALSKWLLHILLSALEMEAQACEHNVNMSPWAGHTGAAFAVNSEAFWALLELAD